MKDSKNLEVFKEALKRAKEGDLFNYDNWLKTNGVNPRTLNLKFFNDHFRANPDKMVGNQEVLEKIANYIGHFLKENTGVYHIPIIGIKGSGKTLLIRVLDNFTNNYKSNLGRSIDIVGEKNLLLQLNNKKQTRNPSHKDRIYFIDNCEKVDSIQPILENLLKLKGDGLYITSWTPESWFYYRDKISDILPISEEISLMPLKYAYSANTIIFNDYFIFLENAILSIMNQEFMIKKMSKQESLYPDFIDAKFFDEVLIDSFYKYTKGIPGITIQLLLNCIERTFLQKKERIDENIIDETLLDMELYYLDAIVDELTELQLQILSTMIQKTNIYNKGVRPMQLVKEFSLDKSTISYHLKNLKDINEYGFLEGVKIGKSKFYKVKEAAIPFIELKIYLNKR